MQKVFNNVEAYQSLGPGVAGVGFRVYMTAPGSLTFSVEPLLADQGKMVIQIHQTMPGNLTLNELRERCESTLRFYENQLRNFLDKLLGDH